MQQFEGWKEFISLSIAVHLASTFLTSVVSYNMPQDHETTTKPAREQSSLFDSSFPNLPSKFSVSQMIRNMEYLDSM